MLKAKVQFTDTKHIDLEKKIAKLKGAVDVGIFGEQDSELIIQAASNEFGTDIAGRHHNIKIPERSFIRSTHDEQKEVLTKSIDKAKVDVVIGKISKDKFLNRLGLFLEGKIVAKINDSKQWAQDNADSTVAAKTRGGKVGDQPLVDTGRMKQSVTHKLVK